MRMTHNLTHNRKRAGGSNGAESAIVSDFPEQKGPQSTGKRYSEGWQSVGKDEVSSSNLDSSSTQIRCPARDGGFLAFLVCYQCTVKTHTETHTDKQRRLAESYFWPVFFNASLKIWLARFMLSWSAWVYIRRVTALSLWPSFSETLATSAPLVIAMLAKVCRSLWG